MPTMVTSLNQAELLWMAQPRTCVKTLTCANFTLVLLKKGNAAFVTSEATDAASAGYPEPISMVLNRSFAYQFAS